MTSLAGGEDAHLDVEIANNMITLNGGLFGTNDVGLAMDWNGPSRILLASNLRRQTRNEPPTLGVLLFGSLPPLDGSHRLQNLLRVRIGYQSCKI